MKVAVVGAGAIGAYVGAALARGGTDVVLIARGEHLEAMREHGVRVVSDRGDFASRVDATDHLDAIADADFVFLGLKAYSLPPLAHEIGDRMRADATVVSSQNGIPWWYFQLHGGPLDGLVLESVDPAGSVAKAFPAHAVVGCVVYASTEIQEPGVIRHVEGTRFTFGEPDRTMSDRCAALAQAFADGGLKGQVSAGLRDHVWLKLVGNAAFNPVSAITRATMHELGALAEVRSLLYEVMSEAAQVANALGVEFPVSLDRRLERGLAVGDHKTSMLQDLEAGKPLEYDCMTGAVVELAARLDIAVPSVQAVHACIKFIDSSRRVVATSGRG